MALLKSQRNEFFEVIQEAGINPLDAIEESGEEYYRIDVMVDHVDCLFCVFLDREDSFRISMNPGYDYSRDDFFVEKWEEVIGCFTTWADRVYTELETPDLWAEAAKTAQLFTPTTELSDDKFTRTELAEVQGQLRLLQLSFTHAALPETSKQKLIELTQTAAVKAEGLTKKDWQNWVIGGFISAITSLALNPTQDSEVLKLVKAAFGGLFLH
jgi:hypothetical protein